MGTLSCSEGKGHTFESCRVRHKSIAYPKHPDVSESKTHHKLTKNNPALAQNPRGSRQYLVPGKPKSKAGLTNVGRLCRWIESTHGVPKVWPNGFPNPPIKGNDPGHHNRNEQNWRTQGGHYGHCHVPVNTHWDPAYTADEVAFVMAVPADAGHLVVAEKELLPAMLVQSARPAKPKKTGGAKKAKSAVTPRKKGKVAPKRSRK